MLIKVIMISWVDRLSQQIWFRIVGSTILICFPKKLFQEYLSWTYSLIINTASLPPFIFVYVFREIINHKFLRRQKKIKRWRICHFVVIMGRNQFQDVITYTKYYFSQLLIFYKTFVIAYYPVSKLI